MAEASQPKGQLPYGWIVRTSKRYPDRIYYFNINTGATTWECPELDPPRTVSEKPEDCLNHAQVPPAGIQEEKHAISVRNKAISNLKDALKTCFSSDGSKFAAPPTAVVVPVPHQAKSTKKPSPKQKLPVTPPVVALPKAWKITPKKDGSVSCQIEKYTPSREQKTKAKKKKTKKKVSVLNRSDSELEQKPKSKKLKKALSESSIKLENENAGESSKVSLLNVTTSKAETDDVEMLDVEGSIAEIEEIASSNETVVDTFASYYVVVDTNVLISELNLINELKDTPVNGCGPPHIFIAWVVIQELDRLKSNKTNKNAQRGACVAIRYLNSVLGKHPRFHGQSPAEAESWAKTYSRCNDDRILECCMALGDKMSQEKVILLTNDKNLINKARICSINVHDWKSMMNSLKPDVVFCMKKAHETTNQIHVTKPVCSVEVTEKRLIVNQRNVCEKEIHTIMANARQLLKNILFDFVEEKMNSAYGKAWKLFPFQWHVLEGILLAIVKYWKVVFSENLGERQRSNIDFLYEIASRPQGFYCDKEECLKILAVIEEVFKQIQKICPSMPIQIKVIQDFRKDCVETFSAYHKLDNSVREAERSVALSVFDRNWSAMNHLCGVVLDFCKIDHSFQYVKPKQMPSEIEVRKLLCNLYPGVLHLKEIMSQIIEAVQKNLPTKKITTKLHKALKNFIPSLEVPYDIDVSPLVTAQIIDDFCNSPRNREMIEIGFKQVDTFFSKLDEAICSLMASKFGKKCGSPERMVCD